MQDAVIVSAVRTPTGKFLGGLKDFSATDLGAMVVRETVRRAGIDPARELPPVTSTSRLPAAWSR